MGTGPVWTGTENHAPTTTTTTTGIRTADYPARSESLDRLHCHVLRPHERKKGTLHCITRLSQTAR